MRDLFITSNLIINFFIIDWAAAEETHVDGGRHWHAFVRFHQNLRGRDPTIFDISVFQSYHYSPIIDPIIVFLIR